jgi:alkylation response protein AidB-like acyl-CoA dehydrogenase
MTDTIDQISHDVIAEVTSWLEDNWDPDLTVGEWWDRLGTSGWAAPTWPVEWFGKGLSREEAVRVQRAIADFGALGAPGGIALLLAGPTIVTHGSDEQKDRYLRDIVTGRKAWCQLFSEPGAGSDLAGLQTRAVKDGDEWIVNGQKVWTSGGQVADLGILVARTDPDSPKHQGITYFAFEMRQPGVEVRPLREITGRSMFNEVFLTDARVADAAVLGGLNNGWAVANTTLAYERAGLGAGGARPGHQPPCPGRSPVISVTGSVISPKVAVGGPVARAGRSARPSVF